MLKNLRLISIVLFVLVLSAACSNNRNKEKSAEDKFDLLVEDGHISFQDLTKETVNQISIGTPETVPAGKYAKESYEKTGIWNDVESKIVFAKDVRQVLHLFLCFQWI